MVQPIQTKRGLPQSGGNVNTFLQVAVVLDLGPGLETTPKEMQDCHQDQEMETEGDQGQDLETL